MLFRNISSTNFTSFSSGFLTQFEEEIEEDSHELNQDVTSPQQQLFEYEFINTEPSTKRKRNLEQFQNHFQAIHYDGSYSRKQFMLGLMPEVCALSEEQMKVFRRKVLVLLDEITEGSEDATRSRQIKSEPVDGGGGDDVYTIS